MNKELAVSYNILKNVYIQNAFSSIQLNKALSGDNSFSHSLVTKIVYGVLDNDILLDYFLQQFYSKKPKTSVLVILKMGAYISKFLNSMPDFALVNEMVNLAKAKDKAVAGFVNATLKNVVKTQITLPSEHNFPMYLSVKYSYPLWLVNMLLKQNDKQFVENLLKTTLSTLTHVRVNLQKISVKEFEDLLTSCNIEYQPSPLQNAFYVNYQQLLKCNQLENAYVVMGLTSMNLVNMINPKPNATIFDACAAPGGKSLYLSQLNNSVKVVAGDLYPHRVQLVQGLADKYSATNITPIVNDATKLNPDFVNKFDVVVCDVPCSGIGVVGKKPDILLNRKESDIPVLCDLQQTILQTSSNYVKVGGELFYSTCTILKQENQEVVFEFLKNNPNFKLVSLSPNTNIKYMQENGVITYYPNISQTEGFFIAKLVKESENH